jgi:hypothetical protein
MVIVSFYIFVFIRVHSSSRLPWNTSFLMIILQFILWACWWLGSHLFDRDRCTEKVHVTAKIFCWNLALHNDAGFHNVGLLMSHLSDFCANTVWQTNPGSMKEPTRTGLAKNRDSFDPSFKKDFKKWSIDRCDFPPVLFSFPVSSRCATFLSLNDPSCSYKRTLIDLKNRTAFWEMSRKVVWNPQLCNFTAAEDSKSNICHCDACAGITIICHGRPTDELCEKKPEFVASNF